MFIPSKLIKHFKIQFYNFLKYFIAAAILYFIIKIISNNWDKIKYYNWDIHYFILLFSFPFQLFNHFFGPFIFLNQIRLQSTSNVSYWSIFKAVTISDLGAYVPGRVWGIIGLSYYIKQLNIRMVDFIPSLISMQVTRVFTGLIYGLLAIKLLDITIEITWGIFPFIIAGIVAIHPRLMNKWVNYLLIKMKKETIAFNYSVFEIMKISFLFVISYIFYGIAFAIFLISVNVMEPKIILLSFFLFPLSMIMSYLAFFVPAGIGVREGILALGLSAYLPIEVGIILAFGYRLYMIIVKLIVSIFSLKIRLPEINTSSIST